MNDRVEIGAINGRFQPFHHGHAEYVFAALRRSQQLIIGITNPHASSPHGNRSDLHRDLPDANPFTYFERLEMIRDFLLEMDIPRERFEIVPFPIEEPAVLYRYIPRSAVNFFTIYDRWGQEKIERLGEFGFQTETLWERPETAKITNGTAIRRAIKEGHLWEHLVPPAIYKYIIQNELHRRIAAPTLQMGKP